jgi:hypothetical protein
MELGSIGREQRKQTKQRNEASHFGTSTHRQPTPSQLLFFIFFLAPQALFSSWISTVIVSQCLIDDRCHNQRGKAQRLLFWTFHLRSPQLWQPSFNSVVDILEH